MVYCFEALKLGSAFSAVATQVETEMAVTHSALNQGSLHRRALVQ